MGGACGEVGIVVLYYTLCGVCFVAYNHRLKNIQGRLALATRLRLIHPLHHCAILLFRLIILMVQFAQLLVPLKQHRYQIHLL